jgi:hypothetical protein
VSTAAVSLDDDQDCGRHDLEVARDHRAFVRQVLGDVSHRIAQRQPAVDLAAESECRGRQQHSEASELATSVVEGVVVRGLVDDIPAGAVAVLRRWSHALPGYEMLW